MRNRRVFFLGLIPLLLSLLLLSCYDRHPRRSDAFVQYSEQQLDSLTFQSTHHYTNNYNFAVKADSFYLLRQQPEEFLNGMSTDSFLVRKHERLVVAEIRMMSTDSIDSVWVQLATERSEFGWIREGALLRQVVPDDPISQFISVFSDVHLLISLVVVVLIAFGYWLRTLFVRNVPMVHFRDINSFYPTLLVLIVACAATFYASIQMFAPDMWRHFYYYPTLNPFAVPPLLSVFLASVWAMLVVGVAVLDDVRTQLPFGDAVLYLSGLVAVCAMDYVVFSVSTLYYIGYLLLVGYVVFAVWGYLRHGRVRYVCGHCGAKMREKGTCPNCGSVNQ